MANKLEIFVSKKMFCDGGRLMSGKLIKRLLKEDLIWPEYDSEYMKGSWFKNLRDDGYYFIEKNEPEGREYDYWYSVYRVYLRNRPEEELEVQAQILADKARKNRPIIRRPRLTRAV